MDAEMFLKAVAGPRVDGSGLSPHEWKQMFNSSADAWVVQLAVDGIYAKVIDAVELQNAGKDTMSPLKVFSVALHCIHERLLGPIEEQVQQAIESTWPGRFDFRNWKSRVLMEYTGRSTYGMPLDRNGTGAREGTTRSQRRFR